MSRQLRSSATAGPAPAPVSGSQEQLRDSLAFALPAAAPTAAGRPLGGTAVSSSYSSSSAGRPSQPVVRRSASYHSSGNSSSSLSEAEEECDDGDDQMMGDAVGQGSDEGVTSAITATDPDIGSGVLLTGPAREKEVDAQLQETAHEVLKARSNAARDKIKLEWMYRW